MQICSVVKSIKSNCIFVLQLRKWYWTDIYDYKSNNAHAWFSHLCFMSMLTVDSKGSINVKLKKEGNRGTVFNGGVPVGHRV
jgi:hypothetical protein